MGVFSVLLGAGSASAVVINFDSLANGAVVTNQFPEATFNDITRIRIHSITDAAGLGWDDFSFGTGEVPAPVPEPGTLLLVGTSLAGAVLRRQRRK